MSPPRRPRTRRARRPAEPDRHRPVAAGTAGGAPRTAAAGADLHDHRHPDAVPGHARDLVAELERAAARDRAWLGSSAFAGRNYATVFTDGRLRARRDQHGRAHRLGRGDQRRCSGSGWRVLLDRKFPGRGLARTLLIAPFLVMPVAAALLWKHALYNPDYGLINGSLNWVWQLFGAEEGPVVDWISVDADAGGRRRAGLAVDAVHDADPAGRAAVPAAGRARGRQDRRRVTGRRSSGTSRCRTCGSTSSWPRCSARSTWCRPSTRSSPSPRAVRASATTNLPYEIYLTMFRKFEYGEAAAAGVVVVHRHDHRRHVRAAHRSRPCSARRTPMSTDTETRTVRAATEPGRTRPTAAARGSRGSAKQGQGRRGRRSGPPGRSSPGSLTLLFFAPGRRGWC